MTHTPATAFKTDLEKLLPLSLFAKEMGVPESFIEYIKAKSLTDFKEDFSGNKPALVFVQSTQNKAQIYLYRSEIKNFVKRHFLLFQLLGLKKKTAEALFSDALNIGQKSHSDPKKITSFANQTKRKESHQNY